MAENYYSEHTGAAIDDAITKVAGLHLYQHNIAIEHDTLAVTASGVTYTPSLARVRIQIINTDSTPYNNKTGVDRLYNFLKISTSGANRAALISSAPFTRIIGTQNDEMTLGSFETEFVDGTECFRLKGWVNNNTATEQIAGYLAVSDLYGSYVVRDDVATIF